MIKNAGKTYEQARQLLGTVINIPEPMCPVEFDPIRRFCHMVDDDNPLYLDEAFAAKTSYRGIICPPLFIEYFAVRGPWPPPIYADSLTAIWKMMLGDDNALLNLETDWEFHKPVRLGDRLKCKIKIAEVYQKPIRFDPEAIWIRTETEITHSEGVLVATMGDLMIYYKKPA